MSCVATCRWSAPAPTRLRTTRSMSKSSATTRFANTSNPHHWLGPVNGYRGETLTVSMMKSVVDLDLWYINNWSIWLDAKIILRTVVQVTRDPVAY